MTISMETLTIAAALFAAWLVVRLVAAACRLLDSCAEYKSAQAYSVLFYTDMHASAPEPDHEDEDEVHA